MFLMVSYLETRSCFPPQFAVRPRWRVEFSHYVVHCLVFLSFNETFSRLLSGRFRASLFSMPRDRSDWHFAQDAAFGARYRRVRSTRLMQPAWACFAKGKSSFDAFACICVCLRCCKGCLRGYSRTSKSINARIRSFEHRCASAAANWF